MAGTGAAHRIFIWAWAAPLAACRHVGSIMAGLLPDNPFILTAAVILLVSVIIGKSLTLGLRSGFLLPSPSRVLNFGRG